MAGRKLTRQKLADNEPILPLSDPIPKGRKSHRTAGPAQVLSPEVTQRVITPPTEAEVIPDIVPEVPPSPPTDNTRLTDVQAEEFRSVLFEVYARRNEALRIFEELEEQSRFFASQASERIAIGGNRGGKAQPVDEPVLTPDGWQEIGSLQVGDVVTGGDGKPCVVTGVFPQGVKSVFRVTFDDGAWTRCCNDHLWKVAMRRERFGSLRKQDLWQILSLGEIRKVVGDNPTARAAPAIPVCEPLMPSRTTPIRILRSVESVGQLECVCIAVNSPDQTYVTRDLIVTHNTTATIVEIARAVTNQDPYGKYPSEGKCILVGRDLSHCSKVFYTKLFKPGAFKVIRDPHTGKWRPYNPNDPIDAARIYEVKKAPPLIPRRFYDYDQISWEDKKAEIPKSIPLKTGWTLYLFSGLAAPPNGWNVDIVCLSGQSMLFDPVMNRHRRIDEIDGPFHVESYNEKTGLIETRPASQPFIKGYGEIVRVTLNNGQEILTTRAHRIRRRDGGYLSVQEAYEKGEHLLDSSSTSRCIVKLETIANEPIWDIHVPGNHNYVYGGTISHNCFDEEITHEEWYAEMAARLLDDTHFDPITGQQRGGKFLWAATPQAGTEQLYDLKCRADDDLEMGRKDDIELFTFGMMENRFVSDRAKHQFIQKFADREDELAVRVHGEFALLGTRVYPEFAPKGVHGIEYFDVPHDWTRYTVTDPGRNVCATLFFAIPPPTSELRGHIVIYDELYIHRCNAKTFASEFVKKCRGDVIWDGVIDHRAGQIHDMGSGRTVEQQYIDELKKLGFKFGKGQCSFRWASDDVQGGIEAVHNALHINADGESEFLFMKDKLKNFCREMMKYCYRKLPSGVVTDEPIKQADHGADCARYGALARFTYKKPVKQAKPKSYTILALEAKKERARQKKISTNPFGTSILVG